MAQVQLVNLLVVHPSLIEHNSLEVPSVARDVPLGLAHLLASTDVRAYADARCGILHCLARCGGTGGACGCLRRG